MYKVIQAFKDKENNQTYRVGEVYPKEGLPLDEDRAKYLESKKNPYKKPFLSYEEDVESTDAITEELVAPLSIEKEEAEVNTEEVVTPKEKKPRTPKRNTPTSADE